MKEIVVISGKGGTGKTSVTASFAYLARDYCVLADCDVDAADMHLLMEPDFAYKETFYSGEVAFINQDKCIKCGNCKNVCRFNAIDIINRQYIVNPLNCEGCGYCPRVCPSDAIEMQKTVSGWLYHSNTRLNFPMVHAKLKIGSDNSGKLVTKVKNDAKTKAKEFNKKLVLVDGSPGVGCPVVSSLSGANYVILVTEPTVSGLHDLKRVYKLVKKFGIKAACIINKSDINIEVSNEIKRFLEENSIEFLTDLEYNDVFTKAMLNKKTVVEYSENEITQKIISAWKKILKNIGE